MAIEIERKFLVRGEEWQKHATARDALRQAYLAQGAIVDARAHYKPMLTLRSPSI
jgi:CYTH domain-containing protein